MMLRSVWRGFHQTSGEAMQITYHYIAKPHFLLKKSCVKEFSFFSQHFPTQLSSTYFFKMASFPKKHPKKSGSPDSLLQLVIFVGLSGISDRAFRLQQTPRQRVLPLLPLLPVWFVWLLSPRISGT